MAALIVILAIAPPTEAASPTFRIKKNVSQGHQNMRNGPGQGHGIVAQIPAGTGGIQSAGGCQRPDDGKSQFNWCQYSWQGQTGWMSSNGLEEVAGAGGNEIAVEPTPPTPPTADQPSTPTANAKATFVGSSTYVASDACEKRKAAAPGSAPLNAGSIRKLTADRYGDEDDDCEFRSVVERVPGQVWDAELSCWDSYEEEEYDDTTTFTKNSDGSISVGKSNDPANRFVLCDGVGQ